MNANGKKARKQTGLNRTELHKSGHTNKSEEKRRRAGWGKSGNLMKKNNGK